MSSTDRAEASRALAAQVIAQPPFAAAEVVLIYATMRSEVDTAAILGAALAAGKRLAYPLVDWPARRLQPVWLRDPARLVSGRFGVPEPPPDQRAPVPLAKIDLALVPGLAFDPAGYRLGYGAGLYDRLLAELPPWVPTWGLAFDAQVLPAVPRGEHDLPVDVVVTQSRWIVAESHGE